MSVTPRASVLTVAVATALLLAGCSSGSQEPPPALSTQPHSTSVQTPLPSSPAAPAPSAAGRTPSSASTSTPRGASAAPGAADKKSAEAFVRAWWPVYDAVFAGDQSVPLATLDLPSCALCRTVAKEAQQNGTKGLHVEGALSQIQSARATSVDGPVTYVATVVSTTAGTLVDKRGAIKDKYSAQSPTSYIFSLVRVQGAWKVQNIDILGLTE